MNRLRPPFNANSMAQRAALAALDDEAHVSASRALNHAEMDKVREGLRALGYEALPSETNFLYFDVGGTAARCSTLLREGIIVRHIEGRMLRVTIGLPEENELFLSALATVTRALRQGK